MTTFDFSNFPTLSTPRLILRDLTEDDADDVLAFRGDYEVQMYNDVPLKSTEEARGFINYLRDGYAAQRRIGWGITVRGDDRVIGLCGYNYWDRWHNRAEVGFDLAKMYWRQGIATEALEAILRFGFTQMNLNRVEAEAVVDNLASVRLLEKLGFQREGVRREFTLEDDGYYHGSAIYGLLRREYLQQPRQPPL